MRRVGVAQRRAGQRADAGARDGAQAATFKPARDKLVPYRGTVVKYSKSGGCARAQRTKGFHD